MKIDIIYRCCEEDTKLQFRPYWFSKLKSLKNTVNVFQRSKIHIIHDGPNGLLWRYINKHSHQFESINKINLSSNAQSLIYCYDFAEKLNTDFIYFLEDDYMHTPDAEEVLIDGVLTISSNYQHSVFTLYDHPDRYARADDYDFGRTKLKLSQLRHWRSAESTTCTWGISFKQFVLIKDNAKYWNIRDREFFRYLYSEGTFDLWQPITGASTHCHKPFLSPLVDWDNICATY